ncbi:MAG: hypothetical protein VW715_15150, partial [Rhodospirillales bacterium]
MTYFAGNTGKFNYGGVDVTTLAGVAQSIEDLNKAAELNADHARDIGVLGAYANKERALDEFYLGQDLRGIQNQADDRSA